MGLVYGVGVNDYDGSISVGGKHNYDYVCWKGILRRCFSEEFHRNRPTYKDCAISDEFLSFDCFREFIVEQKGFNCTDDQGRRFALDKDLLSPNNKIYARDTICFLPVEINSLLTLRQNYRGACLVGVKLTPSGKYAAQISKHGKRFTLGHYSTEIEAFQAYKVEKEAYVKEIAEKWKGKIDARAYNALMEYQVEKDA